MIVCWFVRFRCLVTPHACRTLWRQPNRVRVVLVANFGSLSMSETKAAEKKATTGKVSLVTGATGGIGYQIALGAVKQGTLILPARSKEKAEECAAKLKKDSKQPDADIRTAVVNLDSKASIATFTKWVHENFDYIDVLINNAATVPAERETTVDGLEMQFGVNVFAYYLLMTQLRDLLAKAPAGARIVNVASNYAGGLDLSDPQFTKRRYDPNNAYRATKQADRMLAHHAAKLFAPSKITVNSCHPGVVGTQLLSDLGFGGGSESAAEGAATPLFLAYDKKVEGQTGKYWHRKAETRCPFTDAASCAALWELCAKLEGAKSE